MSERAAKPWRMFALQDSGEWYFVIARDLMEAVRCHAAAVGASLGISIEHCELKPSESLEMIDQESGKSAKRPVWSWIRRTKNKPSQIAQTCSE